MSRQNPIVHRYLAQLDEGLKSSKLPLEERREILGEIENHLGEAHSSGVSLSDAIGRLGSAEDLARAYCLELTFNPRPSANRSLANAFASALTRAGVVLASALMTILLGSLTVRYVSTRVRQFV